MKGKTILSVFLALVLLASLAACGGTTSEAGGSGGLIDASNYTANDALPQEDVHLSVYLHSYNPSVNEQPTEEAPSVFNSSRYLIETYTSLYPNVDFEIYRSLQVDNRESLLEQMAILVNSSQCPDIFFSWGNTFQSQGWLADFNDILETPNQYEPGNERWKDMYFDYMWENGQMTVDIAGNIVAIPVSAYVPGTVGMFYNKDLFAQYNAEIPKTWQELCDLALMFRENDLVGIAPWPGALLKIDSWDFWSMLCPALSVGFEACDEDGDEVVSVEEGLRTRAEGWSYAQNHENVKNVFRLYKYKYSVVLEEGFENIDYGQPWNDGKVAMLEDGLWRIPGESSNTKREFDFDIFLHPLVSTDTDVTVDGVRVQLNDASKVRVPEMTEAGPEKLGVEIAFNIFKPELQGRPQAVYDYGADFLKFFTATDNLSIMTEERAGSALGATKTCRVPAVLTEWMSQPFPKALIGAIDVMGATSGTTSTRSALLQQYVKSMITEDEFFRQWDAEVYRDFMEYVETNNLDISAYDVFVPEGVSA